MRSDGKDLILGLGVFATFAVILFVVIPKGIWVPSNLPIAATSPAFWPRVICVIVMALGLALAAHAATRLRRPRSGMPDQALSEVRYPPPVAAVRIVAAMTVLLAYYVTLRWLGIVVASILALATLSRLYGETRWWLIALLSIALPLILYVFFADAAHVPLPMGWFG